MMISKTIRNVPAMNDELQKRRFIWLLTKEWLKSKKDRKLRQFWINQGPNLQAYHKKYPNNYERPLPDAPRPALLITQIVSPMVASGSQPRLPAPTNTPTAPAPA